jgi:hypothetical protein
MQKCNANSSATGNSRIKIGTTDSLHVLSSSQPVASLEQHTNHGTIGLTTTWPQMDLISLTSEYTLPEIKTWKNCSSNV